MLSGLTPKFAIVQSRERGDAGAQTAANLLKGKIFWRLQQCRWGRLQRALGLIARGSVHHRSNCRTVIQLRKKNPEATRRD
jgi:hypothetical protein